jgi:hypothetical protein
MPNLRLTWFSSGQAVIRICAVLVVAAALEETASATPMTLNVDRSVIGATPTEAPFLFTFNLGDQLDGLTLNGQTIRLDFLFSDNILARVRGGPVGGFGVATSLTLQTNAGTFPGSLGEATTGFFIGGDGNPLHRPLGRDRVGSGAGANGTMFVGLVPGIRNFDMSGVHYDIDLPATGYQVTGGSLSLFSAGTSDGTTIRFERAHQLPEGDLSPWTLVVLAGTLVCVHARRHQIIQNACALVRGVDANAPHASASLRG